MSQACCFAVARPPDRSHAIFTITVEQRRQEAAAPATGGLATPKSQADDDGEDEEEAKEGAAEEQVRGGAGHGRGGGRLFVPTHRGFSCNAAVHRRRVTDAARGTAQGLQEPEHPRQEGLGTHGMLYMRWGLGGSLCVYIYIYIPEVAHRHKRRVMQDPRLLTGKRRVMQDFEFSVCCSVLLCCAQAMDDYLCAKMHLVDLAGSERAKRTKAEGEGR